METTKRLQDRLSVLLAAAIVATGASLFVLEMLKLLAPQFVTVHWSEIVKAIIAIAGVAEAIAIYFSPVHTNAAEFVVEYRKTARGIYITDSAPKVEGVRETIREFEFDQTAKHSLILEHLGDPAIVKAILDADLSR